MPLSVSLFLFNTQTASMSDFETLSGLDLFALQQDLHSHHQQATGSIKCPKCNSNHEYKPAIDKESKKDHQIFSSGELRCSSSKCSSVSQEAHSSEIALYSLGTCGHLLCKDDFKQLGGKVGENASQLDCPTCSKNNDKDDNSDSTSLLSHGASVVVISAGKEPCPICLEDFTDSASMVALACGHVFCMDDFKQLGGKIGQDATMSLEEVTRQREDQVQQLQAQYGTTIPQLIEQLSVEDVETVGVALTLLAYATNCQNGDAATFLQHGGPLAIVRAMRRFHQSRLVIYVGCKVLASLLCVEHHAPQDQSVHARAMIDSGVVSFCIDTLEQTTDAPPILSSVAQLLLMPMFQSIPFLSLLPGSMNQLKIMVKAAMAVMERNPDSPVLLGSLIDALKCLTGHFERTFPGDQIRFQVVKFKGMDTIVAAMRRFLEDPFLVEKAIGTLCHISHHSRFVPQVQQAGAISLTCIAMQVHISHYYVQRNGCNFLWAVANVPETHARTLEEKLVSNNAVQRLGESMAYFPDSTEIQTQACSALENMANKFERIALTIVNTGCIENVVKAMESHSENIEVCYQAALVLSRLSNYEDNEIRFALTETDAIPALQSVNSRVDAILMAPFRGRGNAMMQAPTNNPFALLHLSELVGNALGKLGAQDINMIGDDEYDYDNEEDSRGDIDDPPFDVASILDRDLSASPPGWYKSRPFTVDFKRIGSLANEHIKSFLFPQTEPKVGQEVVIRASLPFGGRGYLYGAITSIGPIPSDDDLRASESFRFEKPCACSNPALPIQDGKSPRDSFGPWRSPWPGDYRQGRSGIPSSGGKATLRTASELFRRQGHAVQCDPSLGRRRQCLERCEDFQVRRAVDLIFWLASG